MTALLQTRDLAIRIAGRELCRALDFTVQPGECWALLGRNGSGKTTLLHTLAGLRAPAAGSILLQGEALDRLPRRRVAQRLGLVFQQQDDSFPNRVEDSVHMGRYPHQGWLPWDSDEDRRLCQRALQAMELETLAQRNVQQLSGGERQRVAIAGLLAQDPPLALLDEPASHLDLHQQMRILEYLARFSQQEGKAVVLSLHDINLALRFCTHALLLYGDGECRHGSLGEVVTEANLEKLYRHPLQRIQHGERVIYLPA